MRKDESHAPPQVPMPCHFQPLPPSIPKANVNHNGEKCNDGSCLDIVKLDPSKHLQRGGTYSHEHPVSCPPYETRRCEATIKSLQNSSVIEIGSAIQCKPHQVVSSDQAYVSEKYAHDNHPIQPSINWHTVPGPSRLTFSGSNEGHREDSLLERRLTWTLVRFTTCYLIYQRLILQILALSLITIPLSKSTDIFLYLSHRCFSSRLGSMPLFHRT